MRLLRYGGVKHLAKSLAIAWKEKGAFKTSGNASSLAAAVAAAAAAAAAASVAGLEWCSAATRKVPSMKCLLAKYHRL